MSYSLIYDGNCNLCVTFTQLLERFDRAQQFTYIPMQDQATLAQLQITEQDCELGMILIETANPSRRWQGSAAAEEIVRLLPLGAAFLAAYRAIPGMKWIGDRTYEQVRDHRYAWFGQRNWTYRSAYPTDPSTLGTENTSASPLHDPTPQPFGCQKANNTPQ